MSALAYRSRSSFPARPQSGKGLRRDCWQGPHWRMLRVDGAGVSRQVILWGWYEAPSAANRTGSIGSQE